MHARSGVLEREEVRGGDVGDVDVIAHAGTVRRRVVLPEDHHVPALAERRL